MAKQPTPLSEEEKEILRRGRVFQFLFNTEGWKLYREVLQEQLDIAGTQAVAIPEGIDGIIQSVAAKGTLKGLRLALETPSLIVQQRQDLIERNPDYDDPD